MKKWLIVVALAMVLVACTTRLELTDTQKLVDVPHLKSFSIDFSDYNSEGPWSIYGRVETNHGETRLTVSGKDFRNVLDEFIQQAKCLNQT